MFRPQPRTRCLRDRQILDLSLKTPYDPRKNRGQPVLNPKAEPIRPFAVPFNQALAAAKGPRNVLVCSVRIEGGTVTADPRLPSDPLTFIRERVRAGAVFWTYHVNMRLVDRFIARRRIFDSVDTYEIIESYPADKYLPSYLILA